MQITIFCIQLLLSMDYKTFDETVLHYEFDRFENQAKEDFHKYEKFSISCKLDYVVHMNRKSVLYGHMHQHVFRVRSNLPEVQIRP